jgi:uncharacterized protein YjbJ (UPF0337 family)
MADKAQDRTEQAGGELKERIGEATGDEQLTDEGKVERVVGAVKDAGHRLRDEFTGADEDAEYRSQGDG